jgi:hypothetical protein
MLELKSGFTSGVFSLVDQRMCGTMNSFIHGDSEQLHRSYIDSDLIGNFSEKDRVEILLSSKAIAIIPACTLLVLDSVLG